MKIMHAIRPMGVTLLLAVLVGLPGVAFPEEEGVKTGYVQSVEDGGYVVIGDRRYRTEGKRVQPPPDVSPESDAYETEPFREGMIVRFSVAPGDPPAIHEAWAVD